MRRGRTQSKTEVDDSGKFQIKELRAQALPAKKGGRPGSAKKEKTNHRGLLGERGGQSAADGARSRSEATGKWGEPQASAPRIEAFGAPS